MVASLHCLQKRTFGLKPSIPVLVVGGNAGVCSQGSEGPAEEQQWGPVVGSCTEGAIQENM